MRKLASVQKITAIREIPGADKIVSADVLGWSVVVLKDEFQVGQQAVYFEIDSWLDSTNPAFASFEDRFSNWGTKRGMRLRTIKLRKQISQGLLMPISKFSELQGKTFNEGDDLTEILKIEKWEHEEEARSNAGGVQKQAGAKAFPSFIRKTDQERVQNMVNRLSEHSEDTFEVSIKLDGSSMTLFHVGMDSPHYEHILEDQEIRKMRGKSFFGKLWYKFKKAVGVEKAPKMFTGVCSRNIQLDIDDDNHFSSFARENKMIEALEVHGLNIAVQGELVAPTIQGNYEKVEKYEFYVYDIFDIDKQKYLMPEKARFLAQQLGFNYVPVLGTNVRLSDISDACDKELVEAILNHAEGPGMNKGVKREGLCWKSNTSDVSWKAISNSYLLKKEGK